MIYHLTNRSAWQTAQAKGKYIPENYDKDGFIHCSELFQIEKTANRFYREADDHIILEIETDGTDLPLKYENLEGGQELFPHIYGALPLSAVTGTFRLQRGSKGEWRLPAGKDKPVPLGLTEMPFGLPGKMYRSPMPYSFNYDPKGSLMAAYLEKKIDVVLALNPGEELLQKSGHDLLHEYRLNGMQVIHAPTEDFSAPPSGHWNQAILEAEELLEKGKNVAIHCHAGVGRTGMFLACMARDLLHLDAREAIAWVRNFIPSAVESEYQRQFVHAYQPQR